MRDGEWKEKVVDEYPLVFKNPKISEMEYVGKVRWFPLNEEGPEEWLSQPMPS